MNAPPIPAGSSSSDLHLATLEGLLSISVVEMKPALVEAADLVARALRADKVDVFLYDASRDTLVALGSSKQPLSALQKKHGLDVLPVSNGGRTVEVFATGATYASGKVDEDDGELRGIREALCVRSEIGVALEVAGQRRGILLIASLAPEQWGADDVRFAESVGRWVSAVVHQADLVAEIERSAIAAGRRSAAEELVTVVAHDLRNFIYPIDLVLQLIERRAERDARAEDVRDGAKARRALSRLNALVNDILDVARIEQGILSVDPRPTAFVPLVEAVVSSLSTAEHPVTLDAKEEIVAIIDVDRIRQCLENLVVNAVKHSPKLIPVTVTIARVATEGADVVRVDVADQGPGVLPEILPFIFERFVSRPGPTTRAGLGLGLFLARQITLLHGGDLTVDSTPTHGARFTLTLPCVGLELAR